MSPKRLKTLIVTWVPLPTALYNISGIVASSSPVPSGASLQSPGSGTVQGRSNNGKGLPPLRTPETCPVDPG